MFTTVNFILLIFALLQAAGQPNQGSIEGKITISDGSSLGNAEITISKVEREAQTIVVRSDSSGRYNAPDLSPGKYVVRVLHSGYLPCTYGQKKGHDATEVEVTTGQKTGDIDCKLIAQGVISGRVLGDDNEPRVGASVQAFSPRYDEGKRVLLPASQGVTNDLGEYRIYGLAPGRYYVNVSQQESYHTVNQPLNAPPEERYTSTFYPSAPSTDQAVLVDVASGQEVQGIDIEALRSRTFHIRGKVLGLSSSTHYTRIVLHPLTPGFEEIYRGRDVAPDSTGDFDLGGILPGSYVVSASFAKEGQGYRALREVDVRKDDVNDFYLAPSVGIEVHGKVRLYASNGEQEFDSSSVKIGLRAIRVVSEMDDLSTQTTSHGNFRLQGVTKNIYSVNVEGLLGNSYVKGFRLNNVDLRSNTVDLTHAENTVTLDVIAANDGGEIKGLATDKKGQVAESAVAVLVPDADRRDDETLFREAKTDKSGHFTIRGIIPGKYKIFVWDDIDVGESNDPAFLRTYESQGVSVQIDSNDRKSVDVQILSADRSHE